MTETPQSRCQQWGAESWGLIPGGNLSASAWEAGCQPSGDLGRGPRAPQCPSAPPVHIHILVPGGSHSQCCSPRFPQRAGPHRRAVVKGRLGPQSPDLWALPCGLSSIPGQEGPARPGCWRRLPGQVGSEQGLESEGVRRGWKVRAPPAKGHGVW